MIFVPASWILERKFRWWYETASSVCEGMLMEAVKKPQLLSPSPSPPLFSPVMFADAVSWYPKASFRAKSRSMSRLNRNRKILWGLRVSAMPQRRITLWFSLSHSAIPSFFFLYLTHLLVRVLLRLHSSNSRSEKCQSRRFSRSGFGTVDTPKLQKEMESMTVLV